MTGSTVDSMALAVENAEVMLIGVSRHYKESTNCRLEAQYAMQREVPTIPLMLVDGYRADGWLGMLIGTRMWYGFFGAVLSDDAQFDRKVSELCRDLGERGRGGSDAVSHGTLNIESDKSAAAVQVDGHDPAVVALRSELRVLKTRQLRKRAATAGVSAEAVDDAEDADDEKAALIELIVSRHGEVGAAGQIVTVLEGGGDAALELLVSVLEHSAGVLEGVSSSTPRKERRAVREVLERVELLTESLDVSGANACASSPTGRRWRRLGRWWWRRRHFRPRRRGCQERWRRSSSCLSAWVAMAAPSSRHSLC